MTASIAYLSYTLLNAEDKRVFMPGELTSGHHQIGISCNACHGESFTSKDSMQEQCESCHGDQREKPFDSHPRSKFTDPRNADRLENINALYCVSCHIEHKPEISDKNGVTQAADFCIHCHEDIGRERPSHQGMEFETCASAGCHNYHNNRSLYTDFLVKHMDEPEILDKPLVNAREFKSVLEEIMTYPHDRYPVQELTKQDMDAPLKVVFKLDENKKHIGLATSHAKSGVNCSACHIYSDSENIAASWTDKPDDVVCAQCHDIETSSFKQGKHGMRLGQGLSPMTPEQARLPMHKEASHLELSCNSCHQAHDYAVDTAAVDACLNCHADDHSAQYQQSPHYQSWLREQSGDAPQGSGVSCATCHMPRIAMDVNDWLRRTVVQHNQNATLTPNEKMIRPACLNCHGLGFSIDALADEELIARNFNGKPEIHIESIDMAKQDNLRYQQELQQN